MRRQLEEVGEKSSARAKEADVREAQLLGRIEVLALERDQLRAAVDERGSRVAMLQAEADGSADQARLLRDRLHAAEHEAARKIADLGECRRRVLERPRPSLSFECGGGLPP